MLQIAMVLSCLICASLGLKQASLLDRSSEDGAHGLKPFAEFLLAAKSASAFRPMSGLARPVVGSYASIGHSSHSQPAMMAEQEPFALPLWVDLRGSNPGKDGAALTELYNGVKELYTENAETAPAGPAVLGIIHTVADIQSGDASDAGLPTLVVREAGRLFQDDALVGNSLVAQRMRSAEQNKKIGNLLKDSPKFLTLFGRFKEVAPLMNYVMYLSSLWETMGELWEDEKKDLLGTNVLCEIQDKTTLGGLSKVAVEYRGSVNFAAVMKPDAALWFEAMSGRSLPAVDDFGDDQENLKELKEKLDETVEYGNAVLIRNGRQLESYLNEAHQWEDATDVERYHILTRRHWMKKRDQVADKLNAA